MFRMFRRSVGLEGSEKLPSPALLAQIAVRVLLALLILSGSRLAHTADQPCDKNSYECAEYYISHRQFDLGIRTLRHILVQSPDDLRALTLLGAALADAGMVEEANRELARAIKLNPRYTPALRALAVNELHLKDIEQAKFHFQQVLSNEPKDETANLLLGEIYYGEKQCTSAIERYEGAGTRIQTDAPAILHYAHCALQGGNVPLAQTKLSLLRPEDSESHFQAGAMFAEAGAYAAAAFEFGLARRNSEEAYLAGYNQTLAYVRAGDYDNAINTANELLNQGYETAELANVAATAYLKSGRTRQAYNALRLAAHLDPKNEDSYLSLCDITLDMEDFNTGIEIANLGLSHLPNSNRLHLERGVMRAMKGQFDEAEQDFASAETLAPQNPLAPVALGLIVMQKGDLPKAVDILRSAAKRHPQNYFAQYWFAISLTRSGAVPGSPEEEEVLTALEASVQANPNFWHSRSELGKVLLRRDQTDRAIAELEKAAELNPQSTAPLFLLAQAYRRKGEVIRAQELLTRVSKMQQDEREDLANEVLKQAIREGTSSAPQVRNKP